MADDPRLAILLDDYMRDRREGISLRNVHNNVKGLRNDFEKERRETRDRVQKLETKVEGIEKRDQTEDLADALADANGTGRHAVVAIATPQAFPTPFGPQVAPFPPPPPVPKRESGFFSTLWRAFKKKLAHVAGGTLLLVAGHFWGRGCSMAQQPTQAQAATERPASPATSSPPVVPLPFDPATRPATPSAIDAGLRR